MSQGIDLNLLSALVRGRDRAAVVADLDKFFELRNHDQEKVKATIEALLKQSSKQQYTRKPDLIAACVGRLTQDSLDGGLRDRLADRAEEVIKGCYEHNKRLGVLNPHYIAPPPSSQQLAQGGNVR